MFFACAHENIFVLRKSPRVFEGAKISRRKAKGAKKTLESFKEKQANLSKEVEESATISNITHLKREKKAWFEKFKWFISSEGFLVVGARDATGNEIMIKKHTEKDDIVFHTDMAGSPFVVIKKDKADVVRLIGDEALKGLPESPGDVTLQEASSFTGVHGKAWRLGLGATRVFHVNPDQVTKEANSGEFLAKGSFMIRGKTNYLDPIMEYAIGLLPLIESETSFVMMGAPLSAVEHWCDRRVLIEQGNDKASNVAKTARTFFRAKQDVDVPLDDVIAVLPSGGCQVKKERKRKEYL